MKKASTTKRRGGWRKHILRWSGWLKRSQGESVRWVKFPTNHESTVRGYYNTLEPSKLSILPWIQTELKAEERRGGREVLVTEGEIL